MSYRFKLQKPFDSDVRRIGLEQFDRIEQAWSAGTRGIAIHETRKALKRLRALLRLVKSGMSAAEWSQSNEAFKSAGRRLSAARDREVLQQTVARLSESAPPPLAKALRTFLATDEWTSGQADVLSSAKMKAEVLADVAALRLRVKAWKIEGAAGDTVLEGVAVGYRRAKKEFRLACDEPTDCHIHDLRKSIQVHWRQLRLIETIWPPVVNARASAAQALAQTLGDYQDLSCLSEAVQKTEFRSAIGTSPSALIVAACRARQMEIRQAAMLDCDRLLAVRTGQFRSEMSAYWAAAAKASARVETTKSLRRISQPVLLKSPAPPSRRKSVPGRTERAGAKRPSTAKVRPTKT